MKPTKSRLVIGYGDREKSDEGAGCRIAEIIQQKEWKDLEGLSVPYLTPSLSSMMIRAKTVIFVSSYFLFEKMKPEIIIKHFLPDHKSNESNINYPESPFSLLSFTESIYNEKPNAFWILIPAKNHQQGDNFSTSTQAAIQDAITYLVDQQSIEVLHPSG
ncbi:hydrogenase maturation protease [Halothece sp. PCC 7418]|uniref:hydrogenase maturation protease n=1 Tax=Halothece sp. (strain PCC 7418) TaxID=65093 RepID=UPI0002A07272|nr:hydrogenase maturation protease [Halothece sp. PCC 7418]AFZ44314.1 hydrogenase maturation protease [Halothece sp. PCC 7418]